MFVRVERLLIKLRQPASRAEELNALRQRMREQLASDISDDERQLAADVHRAKLAVSAQLTGVTSCAKDSGACCGGVTAHLFEDRELAALVGAGTQLSDLTPPAKHDRHDGCAFRGPVGCTLATEHRPARCVHYVCNDLRRELHRKGQLNAVESSLAELNVAMQRFAGVYAERADREVLAPLIAALTDVSRKC